MSKPKPITEITSQIVRASDVQKSSSSKKSKPIVIEELAKRFIDPETGQPIQVGEAVDFGSWDSEEEGRNWFKYYLPDTYKHTLLDWGKVKTKGGHIKSPVTVEVKPQGGKFVFRVIRMTE